MHVMDFCDVISHIVPYIKKGALTLGAPYLGMKFKSPNSSSEQENLEIVKRQTNRLA